MLIAIAAQHVQEEGLTNESKHYLHKQTHEKKVLQNYCVCT